MELFFKALKQLCKIKSFVGISLNAVRTQIWTALIALLLVRFLQFKARFGRSLSNLLALLRQQLFVHCPLWDWLETPSNCRLRLRPGNWFCPWTNPDSRTPSPFPTPGGNAPFHL